MKLVDIIRKNFLQLLFVFLSFFLMLIVAYYFVSGIVEKQIFRNTQETLKTAETAIRSDLREAEVALLYTGLISETAIHGGASLEEIQAYLKSVTLGIYKESSRIPGFLHIYGYINKKFIMGSGWETPENFNPEEREWYKAAGDADGGIVFGAPYTDIITGKTVISLSKVLRGSGGENLGVIAIDIDFSHLSKYINSLYITGGSHGILCDENLVFLVHRFDDYQNLSMEEAGPGYSRVAKKIREAPNKIAAERILNRYGTPMVLTFKRLYNGWFLGIGTPVSGYYQDVNSMAVILSVLGVIFMFILCFFLVKLSLSKARSDEENMEKSSFLARMSHEIRTPMNSIMGMSELIRRKAVSAEIKEYIEIIHHSGAALLSIINDILDFSKIESRRLEIHARDYFLGSVINDMINMFRPRAAEKSLDFIININSSIPARLYGDDMRLRQIFTNMLSNAIKYTRGGFISMSVTSESSGCGKINLICKVEDSGIGIKPEDQTKLFNEFSRIDVKSNQGIEGTGLGLAITRGLCRAMGGDITFTSEYGKGSVFRAAVVQECKNFEPAAIVPEPDKKRVLFYEGRRYYAESISGSLTDLCVPFKSPADFEEFIHDLEYGDFNYAFISSGHLTDCLTVLGKRNKPIELVIMAEPGETSVYQDISSIPMPVYSISIANILNGGSGNSRPHDRTPGIQFTAPLAKVLIVDDLPTNLRVAKELMLPYNMNVTTCLSGPEALKLVKSNKYDIVFMDHMMPGMDGIETTGLIRDIESRDGYYRNLPVIALTANALLHQQELFLRRGFNDFLAKPVDVKTLNGILEKWLPEEKRVESSRLAVEKSENPSLPDIPGVNMTLGLYNSGGNGAVYFNILEDFCKDLEDRLVQINEALAKGDAKLYETLVHAVKGAAWSIGAAELGEKASWLEKMAAQGELTAVKDKTMEFEESSAALVNNIRALKFQTDAKDGAGRTDVGGLRLDSLKQALAEMDIEAVNRMLLSYASLSLEPEIRNFISELEEHILMFDYDKAIKKIDGLILK